MIFGAVALLVSLLNSCVSSLTDARAPETVESDVDWIEEEIPEDAPTDVQLNLAMWPPLGPASVLDLLVADRDVVVQVDVIFRNRVSFLLDSTRVSLEVPAAALGDGLGTLLVEVTDDWGNETTASFEGTLIDLGPPSFDVLDPLIAAADPDAVEQLAVRVVDGWVLGGVTLTVSGQWIAGVEFPAGYPETTGALADVSVEMLDVSMLAEGVHIAELTVHDAAGNATTDSFVLLVDAQAPAVALEVVPSSPGTLVVDVVAEDNLGGEPETLLWLGGLELGSVIGSDRLIIDTSGMFPGEYTLEAEARDDAGNVGRASIAVSW